MAVAEADEREPPPRNRDSRRRRWIGWLGLGALLAIGASTLVSPRVGGAFVVLLGVDSHGWAFLLTAVAAVLMLAFLTGLVHLALRDRHGWWVDLVSPLAMLLLLGAVVIGIPLGLIAGALSFKNSYRAVGRVDGREIVVQQFAGWDTDDMLDAGFRSGPFVSFRASGDFYLDRPPTGIQSWRFSISTTPRDVLIHYRAGTAAHQAGTLVLPRTAPGAAPSSDPSARAPR